MRTIWYLADDVCMFRRARNLSWTRRLRLSTLDSRVLGSGHIQAHLGWWLAASASTIGMLQGGRANSSRHASPIACFKLLLSRCACVCVPAPFSNLHHLLPSPVFRLPSTDWQQSHLISTNLTRPKGTLPHRTLATVGFKAVADHPHVNLSFLLLPYHTCRNRPLHQSMPDSMSLPC